MKLKSNLQPQIKSQVLDKILSLKSFNDKKEQYHHSIITLRQFDIPDEKIAGCLGNKSSDFCKATFNTILNNINNSTDDNLKAVTGININCFQFIKDKINEDDLTFLQGKSKKHLKIEELQYYLFRITKKVFEGGGYSSDARNYFTCEGFKKDYKTRTNRKIGKEKIAEMNKILNKYDWIKVYWKKNAPNLYVMGKQNPFYYMEGIMEPSTIQEIEQNIKDNERFPVKLPQKDKELKELKKQAKKDKATIAELKKQFRDLEKNTPDIKSLQEDIDFLTERNRELLDEILKYQQQEDENRWGIHNKPVKKPDTFESDLTDLISGKKKESLSEVDVLSEGEALHNITERILGMAG